jgi:16S rRNA (adenine1518-N6/adenine1519-N6)-dimethyltransferase
MSDQPHRARRRFSQNFLHDFGVIARIVGTLAARPGERLIEIGPGQGALTGPLLDAAGRLDAIEIDRDLVDRLRTRFADRPGLVVHTADALKFDFRATADTGRWRVVGNLPYNISTPLLFHLFDQLDAIVDMHFMLQKEVVDRLAAAPGGRTYGRLSVMAQCRCLITPLFDVDPAAFRPRPKVTSSVVRLVPHAQPAVPAELLPRLGKLVTAAFAQRRKTLRNTLRQLLDAEAIRALGIDPGRRAETLSLDEFAALAACLAE